jgi:ribonuclease-3 family protein
MIVCSPILPTRQDSRVITSSLLGVMNSETRSTLLLLLLLSVTPSTALRRLLIAPVPTGLVSRSSPLTLCAASLRPPPEEVVQRLSPVTLAYLGDAVWEREVRERLLWPPSKVDALSTRVQQLACAEGQYAVLERLRAGAANGSFGLCDDELEWVRRGRNASPRGPRRLEAKVYRGATGFETLVGVLHLTNPLRLREVLDFALSGASGEAGDRAEI